MSIEVSLITLFPTMFAALERGITGRAQQQQQLILHYFRPQDYTETPQARVDDRPYGGGPGMIMRYPPLENALQAAKQHMGASVPLIHLSPQGQPLTQVVVQQLAEQTPRFVLLCSRYEGVDERFIEDHVDAEYSVGDYVVSGGELPAMILLDAMTRLLPGVLGNPSSAAEDSFQQGLLDCPHYTRPVSINGKTVPAVLQSGDHQAIADWRRQQSLTRTWQRRPDMLKRRPLNAEESS